MKKRLTFEISVLVETGDDTPTDAVIEMLDEEQPAVFTDRNGMKWLGIKLPNVAACKPVLKEIRTPN